MNAFKSKNNCINNPDCPLSWKGEKYTTEPVKVHLNSDTETLRNHSIMKNIGQIQNFRRNTWDLKKLKAQTQVQFYLLKRCRPTKGTRICYLCLNEKFLSLKTKETFLTKEMNLSLSEDTETNLILCTTKPDHCVENVLARKFFFCWQFFLAFGLNMEAYRVNLRSHSECGEILARASRMWTLFTQWTS